MARHPAIPCDSTAPSGVDALDVWREDGAERQQIAPRVDRNSGLPYQTRLWLVDHPSAGRGRHPALVPEHADSPLQLDPHDCYQLRAGQGRMRTGTTSDTTRQLQPGHLQFVDMMQEAVTLDAVSGDATLCLGRDLVEARHPEARRLHGRVIRSDCARVLAKMLRTVPDYFHQLSDDGAAALSDAFRLLALRAIAVALADATAERHVDHLLLARVTEHIRCRLSDQALSPSTICEEFAISRATLYRLFSHESGVARFITRERLGAVHARLATGTDTRPLMDIAHEFGFGSHSSFARSFRQQFGYPPSTIRSGTVARREKRIDGERSTRDAFHAFDREEPGEPAPALPSLQPHPSVSETSHERET